MAKVQGKKTVAGKKVAARKPAAGAKGAKPAPKRPAKAAKASAKAKPAARKVVKKKVAAKPATKPKVTAKGATPAKATKPTRAAGAAASATQQKKAKTAKPSKAKVVAKALTKALEKAPAKASPKTVTRPVAKVSAGPAAAATAATPVRVAAPVDEKKKRRPRPKVTSSGAATATWFSQGEKPRSSSFIPAPPRAEAPSLVAAPPASSDRLVSNDELTAFAVRTAPVRIDVEASAGRVSVRIFPEDVALRIGEGIEWDFRYVGGADVIVDELIVEFEKPAPFTQSHFRSKRPGINRPHRQLSGPVLKSAAGKHFGYTVRAFNAFKTEQATASPSVTVQA